jgi:hypothetical protein
MRALIFAVGLLLAIGQAATYWLWRQGTVTNFSNLSASFSHEQPAWTSFVFASWQIWWLAPVISVSVLVYATYVAKNRMLQVLSTLAAMLVLGGMWYAMYPLHAMIPV